MGAYTFEEIRDHIGHKLECVRYGQNDKCVNVSIECITCGEVLIDLHPNEYLAKEKDNDLTCPECKNDSPGAEYEILKEDNKSCLCSVKNDSQQQASPIDSQYSCIF